MASAVPSSSSGSPSTTPSGLVVTPAQRTGLRYSRMFSRAMCRRPFYYVTLGSSRRRRCGSTLSSRARPQRAGWVRPTRSAPITACATGHSGQSFSHFLPGMSSARLSTARPTLGCSPPRLPGSTMPAECSRRCPWAATGRAHAGRTSCKLFRRSWIAQRRPPASRPSCRLSPLRRTLRAQRTVLTGRSTTPARTSRRTPSLGGTTCHTEVREYAGAHHHHTQLIAVAPHHFSLALSILLNFSYTYNCLSRRL